MIVRVRRGLEANRTSFIPKLGEPLFTTDTKKLYMGDGVTPGGVLVDANTGGAESSPVQSVAGKTGNVTVTKEDVGLSNVPNTDFTAAVAANTAKVSYTDAAKVSGIEAGAQVNTVNPSDLTDFETTTELNARDTANRSRANHSGEQAIATVTGLQTALDGKQAAGSYASTSHGHTIADTSGLQTALDGKQASGDYATNTALAGKANVSHTHPVNDLTATGTKDGTKFLRDDNTWAVPSGSGVTDHGALTGLADDDHTQYHTDARGDARYTPITHNTNTSNPHSVTKSQVGLGNVDNTSNATERAATRTLTNATLSTGSTIDANVVVTEVLKKVYPVGSVYVNKTNATNPATLFGFGTWVAIAGRAVVGKAASGTFATAGTTGGAETHVHGSSALTAGIEIFTVGGALYLDWNNRSNGNYFLQTNRNTAGSSSGIGNNEGGSGGVGIFGNTDSGSSLMPYVVAHMWERTA